MHMDEWDCMCIVADDGHIEHTKVHLFYKINCILHTSVTFMIKYISVLRCHTSAADY